MARISEIRRGATMKFKTFKENLKHRRKNFKQKIINNVVEQFRKKGTISTYTAIKLNLFLTMEERKELFKEHKGLGSTYSARISELTPF